MGLGDGTEKIDEGVRKSVLKGSNKMRDRLMQQREGIVKQEGLAENIQVVTNTPVRSLGPVLELLASARPSSHDAPSVDIPSGSSCPPTHAHPSNSADISTSVDPPTPACPVTPSEVPPCPSHRDYLQIVHNGSQFVCILEASENTSAQTKIMDTSCPQLMQSKGI